MKKCFATDFLRCGLSGWCFECFFTGLHSVIHKEDPKLLCRTSVWMFPIYGMAAVLSPVCKGLKNKHCSKMLRGTIYTLCIFTGEFVTGKLLKRHEACPWDYSQAKLNLQGVVRLDYAPLWFLVGLYYENLLSAES
ncbi:putative ABC transporter permease [Anaerolentibacter hominis]|uniref:putative ABC transporter permease n=1 Tax=Anaerolentibacter hominis TaxID=3079009 RepID=UPI0031B84A59